MKTKKILGLDLGTGSIGWAVVNEAEETLSGSSIEKIGVRVIPLTTDEQSNFEKGKSFSVNQERTTKRGARRSLQRYKLRREQLIGILQENKLLSNNDVLIEQGKNSTHELWRIRAQAAEKKVALDEFARVLLAINKKRGYKSNRKAKGEDEGQVIDGMSVAKKLYENRQTPGQYLYSNLSETNKHEPDFYPSDLQAEFDQIWAFQRQYFPQLDGQLKKEVLDKNKTQTWAILKKPLALEGVSLRDEAGKKLKGFGEKKEINRLRSLALSEQLDAERLAIVLQTINGRKAATSGYLGEISDRSKELYFNGQTIGQWSYEKLQESIHNRLKGDAFYRQDYLDEFEAVWEVQKQFYPDVLTDELKADIRDVVIFYQRPLRSQKGMISICELEGRMQLVTSKRTGKERKKLIGPRVIPKSNPLFQEFRIWQVLNNLEIRNKHNKQKFNVAESDSDVSLRSHLAMELSSQKKLTEQETLKALDFNSKEWELNYSRGLEGNRTNHKLFSAYKEMVELANQEVDFKQDAATVIEQLKTAFENMGIDSGILEFNSDLKQQEIEQQASWQLWHLLYSYAGDDSVSGNEALYTKLEEKFGFKREQAKILANLSFEDDYGNLSARAIRKILPYLKAGNTYSEACELAGYRHSSWTTAEENQERELQDRLEILPKNSLRNPVVEKILNQMVHVVNAVIDTYGRPDVVRIELARELKKSAKERDEMTKAINKATDHHRQLEKEIAQLPQFANGIRITRNDIIRYKLWKELEGNGYKTLYSDTYIAKERVFSKDFDIEHIIPKALLFDDSFSNKTLELTGVNREKSNQTAYDFVEVQSADKLKDLNAYEATINELYGKQIFSKAKRNKLLMKASELGDGFIERDLRNTQYIAKKAQDLLREVVREVTPTTGSVTDRLREDWQLINTMKELNFPVYAKLGLTHFETNKEGQKIKQITDWTKRNDQRHHAMDALTIAFTRKAYIQYLNHLNARRNEKHKQHGHIIAIEKKYTDLDDKGHRYIIPPMPINDLRAQFKHQIEQVLVSYKAKNKVVTPNINRSKTKQGRQQQKTMTPRGQLHKETVYGQSWHYVTKHEKVGTKFDAEKISRVADSRYRKALMERLNAFEQNPKKAFGGKNSPGKNPIFINQNKTEQVPEKVKLVWQEQQHTIRKDIAPDLKIEKVIDRGLQKILQKRLDEYNGNAKEAFKDIENNPVWQNKSAGIAIKRVTITGVTEARPLHFQHNHHGKLILDDDGKAIPSDFIQTGNNHHIAIYQDDNGDLHEQCVSFYEAVERKMQNLSVIDKGYNNDSGWHFIYSMKQNEMFVFPDPESDFDPHSIDLMDIKYNALISRHLYRVQKIASSNYEFRHHLETVVQRKTRNNKDVNEKPLRDVIWKRFQSMGALKDANPVKVRMNHLGEIVHVGEYD